MPMSVNEPALLNLRKYDKRAPGLEQAALLPPQTLLDVDVACPRLRVTFLLPVRGAAPGKLSSFSPGGAAMGDWDVSPGATHRRC